jgi:23S rRNA (cytosine1962-C5)-methyltransferase
LDAFCYLGGFGLNALQAGAKSVTFIDSSKDSIAKIKESATDVCEFICDKAFDALEKLQIQKRQFDIVILDPPAFVKSKKDFFSGMRGYEKLVRLAANLVKKNGILFLASCSHNVSLQDLSEAANHGFRKANRVAKVIRSFGAGFDHPIHPALKESEYLKSICFIVE